MSSMPFTEKYLSQIPAIAQLINLGYEFLTPEEARRQRNGRLGNFLLEGIVRDQLKELNRIRYRGGEYRFRRGKYSVGRTTSQEREVRWAAADQ